MKPAASFLYWCATLLFLCLGQGALAASSSQGDTVAGGAYGFESAKAYLDMQSSDINEAKNSFDKDIFQNIDAANAINIKYKALPPNYILYRLKLAENIEKNAKNPDRLSVYCKQFQFISRAEKEIAQNFMAYNEAMTEKFIPRDTYQVMDDDGLRAALVKYLAAYSMIYGFNKPDAIRISIEKSVPYKNDEGDIGVLYSIGLDEKEASDESSPERFFLLSYCNGEIVSLEPFGNDPADAAVARICGLSR